MSFFMKRIPCEISWISVAILILLRYFRWKGTCLCRVIPKRRAEEYGLDSRRGVFDGESGGKGT